MINSYKKDILSEIISSFLICLPRYLTLFAVQYLYSAHTYCRVHFFRDRYRKISFRRFYILSTQQNKTSTTKVVVEAQCGICPCPGPCVLCQYTVVFAWKRRIFCLCVHEQCRIYIIFIMWNSTSSLDAWYHFQFNISCGVAVTMRGHQKKFW